MNRTLSKEEREHHVYLLMCGWRYETPDFGVEFYVAPFDTSSLIFGLTAAMRTQRKNERGENCERD